MNKLSMRTLQGFTIVELLIVVVVIAILAAITVVAYNGISGRANESAVKSNLTTIIKKIEIEKVSGQGYPLTLTGLNSGDVTVGDDTRVEYASDGSTYCVTVSSIRGRIDYYQSNTTGTMASGKCSGHLGYEGGAGLSSGASSIFGTSAPTGTYQVYNDGGGSLWVGNRFYTTRNNGISILGVRIWEPPSATSPFLATSVSAQLYTQDWQNVAMGGWSSLGPVRASATYSGARTAGSWTYLWFSSPVTLYKAEVSTGTQDYATIGIRYNGTYYVAANPGIGTANVQSQVTGVYLSDDGSAGRSVNSILHTQAAGTYYAIDMLFSPL